MKFKTDKQLDDWQSGKIDKKLIQILNLIEEYLAIEEPGYEITITDLLRTPEEYQKIYNDPDKKPGVHSYGRGADIRTSDMPDALDFKIATLVNLITYDRNRPNKKSAIYNTDKHYDHIHVQTFPGE